MRKYLDDLLKDNDYPDECKTLLLDCYDTIKADVQRSLTLEALLEAYRNNKDLKYSEIEKYVKEISDGIHFSEYTVWLLVYILMTKHLRELYLQKGLSLDIWHNGIEDLRIKAIECKELEGIYGTFVASWFPNLFRLRRFSLGRLQFEYAKFSEENFLCSDGTLLKKGDRTLAVHIPRSDVPLSKENCDLSYEAAAKFFADEFQGEKVVFTCSSWMLYPKNSEILHTKSNVRRFGEEYELVTVKDNKENEHPDAWRIFGVYPDKDLTSLPENSFIQKAYKSYMLAGGITGRAYGVKLLQK